MSRPFQTESAYVQTVPDGKCLCPDRSRRKVPMSRPFQTESAYVQTFVRSELLVRSSCARNQICPHHPRPKAYMSKHSYVLVKTIVRSQSNSCVPTPNSWCVHAQSVRSRPDFRAFTRPQKIHPVVQCYSLKMKQAEGFKTNNLFHRVNLLFKLNQNKLKIFWYILSEKKTLKTKFCDLFK